MPALSMIPIPKPNNSIEFEKLLKCYAEKTFCAKATLLGRSGQAQNGIDIIVDTTPRICIQCKDYEKKKITISDIIRWTNEAEKSPLAFGSLYFAIAKDNDAKLQIEVCTLSDSRRQNGLFGIGIIFWDDIEQKIKEDENLLRVFYPNIFYIGREYAEEYSKILSYKPRQLIMDKEELRIRVLDLVVEYGINDFLCVNPFVGFRLNMVIDCDCFLAGVNDALGRAIAISESPIYKKTHKFAIALNDFSTYMAMICQTTMNCEYTRYTQAFDSVQDMLNHQKKVEELRNNARDCFERIKTK